MNGIKEQLVEDLVEKAFTKRIYIVTPLCFRRELMIDSVKDSHSRAFFTKEAAEEYLRIFDEKSGAIGLIPHVISTCQMNDMSLNQGTLEMIIGQNNNMVRENQIWEQEDPQSYIELQEDYEHMKEMKEIYRKDTKFVNYMLWSVAGMLAAMNFRNAYLDGNLKKVFGIYLVGCSLIFSRGDLLIKVVNWTHKHIK